MGGTRGSSSINVMLETNDLTKRLDPEDLTLQVPEDPQGVAELMASAGQVNLHRKLSFGAIRFDDSEVDFLADVFDVEKGVTDLKVLYEEPDTHSVQDGRSLQVLQRLAAGNQFDQHAFPSFPTTTTTVTHQQQYFQQQQQQQQGQQQQQQQQEQPEENDHIMVISSPLSRKRSEMEESVYSSNDEGMSESALPSRKKVKYRQPWSKEEERLVLYLVFHFVEQDLNTIGSYANKCNIKRSLRAVGKKIKRLVDIDNWQTRNIDELRAHVSSILSEASETKLSHESRLALEAVLRKFK